MPGKAVYRFMAFRPSEMSLAKSFRVVRYSRATRSIVQCEFPEFNRRLRFRRPPIRSDAFQ